MTDSLISCHILFSVDNALEKMLVCPMDEEEAELTDIKVEVVDTSAILSSTGSQGH